MSRNTSNSSLVKIIYLKWYMTKRITTPRKRESGFFIPSHYHHHPVYHNLLYYRILLQPSRNRVSLTYPIPRLQIATPNYLLVHFIDYTPTSPIHSVPQPTVYTETCFILVFVFNSKTGDPNVDSEHEKHI